MTIHITAEAHGKEDYVLIIDGPTYGRRDDLHRLGFTYDESRDCWYSDLDIKDLDILESWPEIRLTNKAAGVAQKVREAQRKRASQRKAADIRAFVTRNLVNTARS